MKKLLTALAITTALATAPALAIPQMDQDTDAQAEAEMDATVEMEETDTYDETSDMDADVEADVDTDTDMSDDMDEMDEEADAPTPPKPDVDAEADADVDVETDMDTDADTSTEMDTDTTTPDMSDEADTDTEEMSTTGTDANAAATSRITQGDAGNTQSTSTTEASDAETEDFVRETSSSMPSNELGASMAVQLFLSIDDDGNGYVDDVYGWDFTDGDNDPTDLTGHGTHVFGIIGAKVNNAIGISGIARNCKVMALRAGTSLNSGGTGLQDSKSSAAIVYAIDNDAKVINMSWGSGRNSFVLQDAINYAYARGAFLVAAGGNNMDRVVSGSATCSRRLPRWPTKSVCCDR